MLYSQGRSTPQDATEEWTLESRFIYLFADTSRCGCNPSQLCAQRLDAVWAAAYARLSSRHAAVVDDMLRCSPATHAFFVATAAVERLASRVVADGDDAAVAEAAARSRSVVPRLLESLLVEPRWWHDSSLLWSLICPPITESQLASHEVEQRAARFAGAETLFEAQRARNRAVDEAACAAMGAWPLAWPAACGASPGLDAVSAHAFTRLLVWCVLSPPATTLNLTFVSLTRVSAWVLLSRLQRTLFEPEDGPMAPPQSADDSTALKDVFAFACFAAATSPLLLGVALDLRRHVSPGCEAAAGDGGGGGDAEDVPGAAFSALLIRALSLSRCSDGPIKAWASGMSRRPLPLGGVASCVRRVVKAAPMLCRATAPRLNAWAAAVVAHLDDAVAFATIARWRCTDTSDEVMGAAHALKLVKSLALYPGLRGGEVVLGPEQVAARGDAIAALIRAGAESSVLAAVDAPWCAACRGRLCVVLLKASHIMNTIPLVLPPRLAARAVYTLRLLLIYIDRFDASPPKIASVLPALLFATRYPGDSVFEPSRDPLFDAPSWQAHLLFDAIGLQLCCAALVDPRTPLAQLPLLLQPGGCVFAANQALRIMDMCLRHPKCWGTLCDPPAQSRCPAALSALALCHACVCAGNAAGSLQALRLLSGPGRRVEMCVAAGLGGFAAGDTERRCAPRAARRGRCGRVTMRARGFRKATAQRRPRDRRRSGATPRAGCCPPAAAAPALLARCGCCWLWRSTHAGGGGAARRHPDRTQRRGAQRRGRRIAICATPVAGDAVCARAGFFGRLLSLWAVGLFPRARLCACSSRSRRRRARRGAPAVFALAQRRSVQRAHAAPPHGGALLAFRAV